MVFQNNISYMTDLICFGLVPITLDVDFFFNALFPKRVMATSNTLIAF